MPYTTFNKNKTILRPITTVDGQIPVNLCAYNTASIQLGTNERIANVNYFLKSLRAYTQLKSIPASSLPNFTLEDTPEDELAKTLAIEWDSARIHLDCLLSNDKGMSWHKIGSISLLNTHGYPYRSHNLLDLYTDALFLELGEDGAIGVQIKDVGHGALADTDTLVISGSYTEEYVLFIPEVSIFTNTFTPTNTTSTNSGTNTGAGSGTGTGSGSGTGGTTTPMPNTIPLTRVSNGDENGWIYYIGTLKKTVAFSNPHTAGNLSVVASDTYPGFEVTKIVDRVNSHFCNNGQANTTITFDFQANKSIKVSGYTIKGRADTAATQPRHWKLEGSKDGQQWTIIDTQTNNTSVNQGVTGYFPVTGQTEFFRYLRWVHTGLSSDSTNWIVLDDFEFYGEGIWT